MTGLFKVCPCCGARLSHAAWMALPFVGHFDELALRNCGCGSTIAVHRSLESQRPRMPTTIPAPAEVSP